MTNIITVVSPLFQLLSRARRVQCSAIQCDASISIASAYVFDLLAQGSSFQGLRASISVTFSHFAAVSGVAGLEETSQSFPLSVPFLFDVHDFQAPPHTICPPQLRSSYRALPIHLHFNNCSGVSVSSILLTSPNHSSILHLITIAMGSTSASSKITYFLRCSNRLIPIAHRTILIYVVVIRVSSLTEIDHVSQP